MKANGTIKNELAQAAGALQGQLSIAEHCLPVYVRFRCGTASHLLPVVGISMADEGVTVFTDGDGRSDGCFFAWDRLTGIEAFCDARRKPVFLHDFAGESFLASEMEEERAMDELHAEKAAAEYVVLQQRYFARARNIPAGPDSPPVQKSTRRLRRSADERMQEVEGS